MSPIQIIVAAVDFSEASHDAVAAAADLARQTHASLHLLHVVPDPAQKPWTVEVAGVDLEPLRRTWTEEATRELGSLAAAHQLAPPQSTTAVVIGAAADEIVRYADAHAASVIVIGSHGQGVVRRFLLGSVADRVIRQAHCAVMVVPHSSLRLTAFEVKAAAGVES